MILLILIISMTNIFLGHLPQEIRIIEGKEQKFPSKVPLTLQLFCEKPFFINGQCLEDKLTVNLNKPLALKSSVVGTYNLNLSG